VRDILARGNASLLRQFAWSRVLLGFDYDGTLAPIAKSPRRVFMRARTRALLRRLAELYPCVIVSGRARRDLQRRFAGIRPIDLVGNHGSERLGASAPATLLLRRWTRALQASLAGVQGLLVENKAYSLSIHYRAALDKRRARSALARAVAELRGVRVVAGKQVLNLLPSRAPHKGTALEAARRRHRCDTAIYLGDDLTDEDVFALARPAQILTIVVGRRRTSRADFCLASQRRVDALLARLVRLAEQRAAMQRDRRG